jgi:hypothetical protein
MQMLFAATVSLAALMLVAPIGVARAGETHVPQAEVRSDQGGSFGGPVRVFSSHG